MQTSRKNKLAILIILLQSSSAILSNFIIPQENIHLIKKAWSVNTAGPGAPSTTPSYYNITINETYYPGLRPWELRWNIIKNAMNYEGQRILELGCCMGLLSTCLKKYCNTSQSTGVDGTDQFLISQGSPDRIKAAQWIARAFEADVSFIQTDLNAEEYESIIGYNHDIIFCFSLLHWIHDKHRFMMYLSNFSNVIFEGHDSNIVEIERFAKYGFTSHKILGEADRGRTIIHFYK